MLDMSAAGAQCSRWQCAAPATAAARYLLLAAVHKLLLLVQVGANLYPLTGCCRQCKASATPPAPPCSDTPACEG